jgi:hypothetical protein
LTLQTGLKRIGVSYSRISSAGVASKLELAQPEEALYLCGTLFLFVSSRYIVIHCQLF